MVASKYLAASVRTIALLCVLWCTAFAAAQTVDSSAAAHQSSTVSRCAKLAALDPKFGPLAEVCQYALSPNSLPSFVCDESIQQFASKSAADTGWRNIQVLTAVVNFEPGKGDKLSNVVKDGRPIHRLEKPHSPADVQADLIFYLKSPAPVLSLFGEKNLLWVFDARDEAEFEYNGEMTSDGRAMSVFGFRVTKSPKHLPAIGWVLGSNQGEYLGLKGLLWVDKATSSLRRVVLHETDFEPRFDIFASSSAVNYDWIQISDLGKFLLPVNAEEIRCSQNGGCRRDLISYSNCHKFAAKSRILPAK
jgi:hypothetical protein